MGILRSSIRIPPLVSSYCGVGPPIESQPLPYRVDGSHWSAPLPDPPRPRPMVATAAKPAAAKPAAKLSAEAKSNQVQEVLTTDPLARRYASLTLFHLAEWKTDKIRKLTGAVRSALLGWAKKLVNGLPLTDAREDSARKGTSVVKKTDVSALQKLLTSGGPGQLGILSLRKAYPKLIANGATPHSRETYRTAMRNAGWKHQRIARAPPNSDPIARAAFCRTEGRRIASNTSFSDSKIFPGEVTSSSTLPSAWCKEGSPMRLEVRQKPRYQAHVYAAITRFGASDLIYVPGTRGPSGRGVGRPRGTGERGGRAGRGGAPAPAAAAPPKSVTAAVYRAQVLEPPQGGLLRWAAKTFSDHGITAWRWQQDGAPGHTIANTDEGRLGRALVVKYAPLVEPWPAHSPDLSPIEKAWAATERYLWAELTWHDLATFKVALEAAWRAVVTPAYCAKLFSQISSTYAVCAANEGALIRGWGPRARPTSARVVGAEVEDSEDSESDSGDSDLSDGE